MRFIIFILAVFSTSAFSAPTEEATLHQLSEFIVVAVTIFSFMFGAQFGHTR